jgi:CheY-like chemotaxis protein
MRKPTASSPAAESDMTNLTARDNMGPTTVRVLLVDENLSEVSNLVRYLKDLGCSCSFARSYTAASALLRNRRFDLVLSKFGLPGGNIQELPNRLVGGRASLFYFYAVEVGCWWIPRVRSGWECWGETALRPGEFVDALREIVAGVTGDVPVVQKIANSAATQPIRSRVLVSRPKPLRVQPKALPAADRLATTG